jgi:hypothetical protein
MGGENADIDSQTSIAGITNEIEKLTSERNGTFFDYTGKILPY